MGEGPDHLLRHGAASSLRASGLEVNAEYVEAEQVPRTEIGTHFELCARVADRVAQAVERGRQPVVLSGNCGIALGTVAGLARAGVRDVGVVWLDAHGEFNTPDTSTSGFLDGMGLAVLTGRCWRAIANTIDGFAPTRDDRILLAGVRDLDEAEGATIAKSDVRVVRAEMVHDDGVVAALEPALDALAKRVRQVYLHVDLDVLDPLVGRANQLAPDGGLTRGELLDVVRLVHERFVIAAAAIGSYDPAYDAEGAVFSAAVALLDAVADVPSTVARS